MADEMRLWVDRVLGEHRVGPPPPVTARRQGTAQRVLEVHDADGRRWFAKRIATPRRWRGEVTAYQRHVPALGGLAPTLHSANEPLRTLLTSAVPGRSPTSLAPEVCHRAGALLRRLHDSPAATTDPVATRRPLRRLERVLAKHPGTLTADESHFVREQTQGLADLPLSTVVCHGDFLPHNWVVDSDGIVRVIDFEEVRPAPAAFDLSKLFYGPLWGRPRLAAALMAGYGRALSDLELEYVRRRMAIAAVVDLAGGRRDGRGRARLSALMAGDEVPGGAGRHTDRAGPSRTKMPGRLPAMRGACSP